MMEQIYQQSNAEASLPPTLPRPVEADWSSGNAGAGWDLGRMPGLHRRLGGLVPCGELGRLGAAVGKVREFGFVCKAGRGGERLRGSRQPPTSPPLRGWCCFSSKVKEGCCFFFYAP